MCLSPIRTRTHATRVVLPLFMSSINAIPPHARATTTHRLARCPGLPEDLLQHLLKVIAERPSGEAGVVLLSDESIGGGWPGFFPN